MRLRSRVEIDYDPEPKDYNEGPSVTVQDAIELDRTFIEEHGMGELIDWIDSVKHVIAWKIEERKSDE